MKQTVTQEDRIDLLEILRLFGRHILVLILAAVVGVACGYLFTKTQLAPEYSSTATIHVMETEDKKSDIVVQNQELQTATLLTNECQEIIQSQEVAMQVISQMNLQDTDGKALVPEKFLKKVEVDIPVNTRILTIKVTDSDPQKACAIANALSAASRERIQKVLDLKRVQVVDEAQVASTPDGPDAARNAFTAGILAVVLVMVILVLRFMFDDRIRTPEDVEDYLGLNVLGLIPASGDMRRGGRHAAKTGRGE